MARLALALAFLCIATGCATPAQREVLAAIDADLRARGMQAPTWTHEDEARASTPAAVPSPLTRADAVRHAFVHSAAIRQAYARAGIARADLDAASRLPNPSLDLAYLDIGTGGRQFTRGIAQDFAAALLLPSHRRIGEAALRRTQREIAHALLELQLDVERAWETSAAAESALRAHEQIAALEAQMAEVARRYHDAGNLDAAQWAEARDRAARARSAADAAQIEAAHARAELATRLGAHSDGTWVLAAAAANETVADWNADTLVQQALRERLDLAALDAEREERNEALAASRRWGWLTGGEIGYEHESETGDGSREGPIASVQLPLFDRGHAARTRAEAEWIAASARADAARIAIANDVRVALLEARARAAASARAREVQLPARTAVQERARQDANYMLGDIFGLARARVESLEAQIEAEHARRDAAIAYARLRFVVGGALPSTTRTSEEESGP